MASIISTSPRSTGRRSPWSGRTWPHRRHELFVAGKTLRANPDGVQDQFDNTRRLLHAEVLDLYQAHAVTTAEELDRRSAALERILALRDQGHTRFAGITGHDLAVPERLSRGVASLRPRHGHVPGVSGPMGPSRVPGGGRGASVGVPGTRYRGHGHQGRGAPPWADRRPLGDALTGDPVTRDRWASSWYEPAADDDDIDRGVHFALSTPGVHGFCTPGDIGLLPRVLQSTERYVPMAEAQRQAAIDAMSSDELIFPMPR